jgi:hypothetical protein
MFPNLQTLISQGTAEIWQGRRARQDKDYSQGETYAYVFGRALSINLILIAVENLMPLLI